jgi:hypothetical protein
MTLVGQVKLELAKGSQTYEPGDDFLLYAVPSMLSNMALMALLFWLLESYKPISKLSS